MAKGEAEDSGDKAVKNKLARIKAYDGEHAIIHDSLEEYPRASLLGLPSELCNEIYELVLIDHRDNILINRTPIEPGLLHTCRQIRQEARCIFQSNNTFYLRFDCRKAPGCVMHHDYCNRAVKIPHKDHWCWHKAVRERTTQCWKTLPSQVQMENYLCRVWEGPAPIVRLDDYPRSYNPHPHPREEAESTFESFELLCALAADLETLPWTKVLAILDRHMRASIDFEKTELWR